MWLTDDAHEVSPDADAHAVAEWAASRPGTKLWRLAFLSCARVSKDDDYIRSIVPKIESAVDKIALYRGDRDALARDFGDLRGFAFISKNVKFDLQRPRAHHPLYGGHQGHGLGDQVLVADLAGL